MAPNGIRALRATTGLLAFTSMDCLEVINVTIWLIEVSIAIIVIAIPLIELCQVSADLSRSFARDNLSVVPGIYRITDEKPGAGADNTTTIVGAIIGFIERDLYPVFHSTIDCVTV